MNYIKPIIDTFKPILPLVVIIIVLKLTGQLGNVISYGQGLMLQTGVFNASVDISEEEDFDYNFQIKNLDGEILSMDSLKGKVVFLNIWATWCGPCRAEMPTIQSLYNSIEDKKNIAFVLLSIDRGDPLQKVKQYVKSKEYTFPVFLLHGEPTEQIHVPTIPTTFIISKSGKVLTQESGMRNYDTNKFRKFLLKEATR